MKTLSVLLMSLLLMASYQNISAQNNSHPLDPLTWQEYWTVLETLQEAGNLDAETRFSHINLVSPDKQDVWNWNGTDTIPRMVYATVHQGSDTYKAVVDAKNRTLASWEKLVGIQPTWLGEEFGKMSAKAKQHPDFIAAMKKRGYDDLTLIDIFFGPPGYFGTEEEVGRRIAHGHASDPRGFRNRWGRHIQGLTVVADMHTMEVLRVVDEGVVPASDTNIDFNFSSIPNIREVPGKIIIHQPNGSGFEIEGHEVEWQKWRFHVRPDHRVGMVMSTITYGDDNDQRRIMYEGFLSEIFVPYMDPAFDWYPRNFIDLGEYTAGGFTNPLLRGLDAPDYAYYMDGLFMHDNGQPKHVPNLIAIFERESGDPSWRHNSSAMGPESRVKRDLVVRAAAVVGNYDYILDWVFQQDGSIVVRAGATGIAEAKSTIQKDATEALSSNSRDDAYGRFVDPHIVAVNHDHYFSYRLDMDVDGSDNSLQIDRLTTKILPEDHPRRSVWVGESTVAKNERDGKLIKKIENPALWRVISNSRKNHVGYPTSYQLMPGVTALTKLSKDDYPRRRAGFINNHLWVTPRNKNEYFAAGEFPTLSEPGEGLPKWTSANRSIENQDIVLWYTMSMHHMVRAEDWPVMPVLWHSFELRPFDFFDRNPALDLPKSTH
ncbi:hypothetical protein G3570_14370 [Balneolaceae bacterium YR4-1]|uniref:Amine oxidase n=1 Tax=Halalkalibaculum roseum TaxID=2709311 RepID=A0A6M1SRX0_9BACT|nr:hypothetical protein [Halalkalibaculum roseum]NGP77829.1 hypothetical protein [Halalkalibaculum roseum]